MVVVSDSRLSVGQHWDANSKIMLLPRSDAVLSFGRDTGDAHPLMLQAWNAIRADQRKGRGQGVLGIGGACLARWHLEASLLSF